MHQKKREDSGGEKKGENNAPVVKLQGQKE